MECPKCGHRQADALQCQRCGVFFAKLDPPSTRRRARPPAARPRKGGGLGVGSIAVLAIAVGGWWWSARPAATSSDEPVVSLSLPTPRVPDEIRYQEELDVWDARYAEMGTAELQAEERKLAKSGNSREVTDRLAIVRVAIDARKPPYELGQYDAPELTWEETQQRAIDEAGCKATLAKNDCGYRGDLAPSNAVQVDPNDPAY